MHQTADDFSLVAAPQPVIRIARAVPAPVAAVVPWARRHAALLILLGLTVFGGWLRFYRLTFPALWNDDGLVYWRVCGTYGQMLVPLRIDLFPPLHYSLYWAIAQVHTLTPWVMRLVPALSGTLTVPAIYFLARQLVNQATSLVAAGFTACSAFMLFYSRDAKMYADSWLFVTLNVGCLLWWFRTGRATAWLAWVACGCAMVGLNGNTVAVVGVSFVFLLTQRRVHWARGLLFLLGTGLIVSGVAVHYTQFNLGAERVEEGGWRYSGLGWVGGFYNGERTGPELAAYAGSSFLAGYEWPRDEYLDQTIEPLKTGPQTLVLELAGILAVAALPWPVARGVWRLARGPRPATLFSDVAPEPSWRAWLWVGAWIALPVYGYYCHSVPYFVSPRRWTFELLRAMGPWTWTLSVAAVLTLVVAAVRYAGLRPMVARMVMFWAATAALFYLCVALFDVADALSTSAALRGKPWESIWHPRYLGIVWPAVGIAVATLLMRLPTRAVRTAAVVFVCAANLGMMSLRMTLGTEPPIDLAARDVFASQGPAATVRTYLNLPQGGIAVGQSNFSVDDVKVTVGRYYLQMLSNLQPMGPQLFLQSLNRYVLRQDMNYAQMRADVRTAGPLVQRVVVWQQLPPAWERDQGGRPPYATPDPYRRWLAPQWRPVSEDWYTIRFVWDYHEFWYWVRREYARDPHYVPPTPGRVPGAPAHR